MEREYKDYIIAGLKVRMATYGRTLEYAEPYLAPFDGEPDIIIESEAEKYVERMRKKHPGSKPTLELGEYMGTGWCFFSKAA